MKSTISGLGLLVSVLSPNVISTPIYYTSAGYGGSDNNYAYVEGTNHVYLDHGFLNISRQWAEASASGNRIHVRAYNATRTDSGSDVVPYYPVARGSITYTGLVFTDTGTSTTGGSAAVKANFTIAETDTTDLMAQLFFSDGASGYTVMRPVSSGNYSSTTATVPLDVPVSLELRLSLFNRGGSDGMGNRISLLGDASMSLTSIPFVLPENITVSSLDGRIIDNRLAPVPVPGALWLFGSGFIALLGTRRIRHMSR